MEKIQLQIYISQCSINTENSDEYFLKPAINLSIAISIT